MIFLLCSHIKTLLSCSHLRTPPFVPYVIETQTVFTSLSFLLCVKFGHIHEDSSEMCEQA